MSKLGTKIEDILNISTDERKQMIVFADLRCRIGDILPRVFTQTKCGNEHLIALSTDINNIIKEYRNAKASKEVCEQVYSLIKSRILTAEFDRKNANNTERMLYDEIIGQLKVLFDEISAFGPRKHLDNSNEHKRELMKLRYSTVSKAVLAQTLKEEYLGAYNECLTDSWKNYINSDDGINTQMDALETYACSMLAFIRKQTEMDDYMNDIIERNKTGQGLAIYQRLLGKHNNDDELKFVD